MFEHRKGIHRLLSDEESYPIDPFYHELRALCAADVGSAQGHRSGISQDQAKQVVALAREAEILVEVPSSWNEADEALGRDSRGTEHIVEIDVESNSVFKITIPSGFGLTPVLQTRETTNVRDPEHPFSRVSVEFVPATPLEYLERLSNVNEVFGDQIRLCSIVLWTCGQVSFTIQQPIYDGRTATELEIKTYFEAEGWKWLSKEKEHVIYQHPFLDVFAIDALPRNCYVRDNYLQPFDVILFSPEDDMRRYLGIL